MFIDACQFTKKPEAATPSHVYKSRLDHVDVLIRPSIGFPKTE
jgi:hypothetical protein